MSKARSLVFKIPCKIDELRLDITLQCGQSFRWRENEPGKWTGMISDTVWTLSQDQHHLHCVLHNPRPDIAVALPTTQANCNKTASKNLSSVEDKDESTKLHRNSNTLQCEQISLKHEQNEIPEDSDPSKVKVKKLKLSNLGELQSNQECILKQGVPETVHSKKLNSFDTRNTRKLRSGTIKVNNLAPDIYINKVEMNLGNLPKCKEETAFKVFKEEYIEDSSSNCVNNSINYHQDQHYYTSLLHAYFRLDVSLTELYSFWSSRDENFRRVASSFPGIRMLDQPSVENVFSFICSSNNNISRISQLVEKLCTQFGSTACVVDDYKWCTFPSINQLCVDGIEDKLRALGFGYRASYIKKSAEVIASNGGEAWLDSLRLLSYEECHKQLCQLTGVGPKVADCICLMSLNQLSTIPVDTHVYQIACRDYHVPQLQGSAAPKTVTTTVYKAIASFFRELYGDYAGWAHSVLFSADLKKFTEDKKKKSPAVKRRKL